MNHTGKIDSFLRPQAEKPDVHPGGSDESAALPSPVASDDDEIPLRHVHKPSRRYSVSSAISSVPTRSQDSEFDESPVADHAQSGHTIPPRSSTLSWEYVRKYIHRNAVNMSVDHLLELEYHFNTSHDLHAAKVVIAKSARERSKSFQDHSYSFNSPNDHQDMTMEGRAAAYLPAWHMARLRSAMNVRALLDTVSAPVVGDIRRAHSTADPETPDKIRSAVLKRLLPRWTKQPYRCYLSVPIATPIYPVLLDILDQDSTINVRYNMVLTNDCSAWRREADKLGILPLRLESGPPSEAGLYILELADLPSTFSTSVGMLLLDADNGELDGSVAEDWLTSHEVEFACVLESRKPGNSQRSWPLCKRLLSILDPQFGAKSAQIDVVAGELTGVLADWVAAHTLVL